MQALQRLEMAMSDRRRCQISLNESSSEVDADSMKSTNSEIQCDYHGSFCIRVSNERKYYWQECFAMFTRGALSFYRDQNDKEPFRCIRAVDLCHVRHATAADIRSAPEEELCRIFQVFYSVDDSLSAQSLDSDSRSSLSSSREDNRSDRTLWNHHDLVELTYRMRTECELCVKPLWSLLRPPLAYECKHAVDAAEVLIMAPTADICERWVQLLKKFSDCRRSRSRQGAAMTQSCGSLGITSQIDKTCSSGPTSK
ncbi:unnamed protein product [Toxocara canis]|uniref:PH domain-containing protein n=1 Tax=Toxocara canis TaxID=6265 RepID=A0A183UIG6_TOXCA|nr:unnamed protein product [Toxocara canis]